MCLHNENHIEIYDMTCTMSSYALNLCWYQSFFTNILFLYVYSVENEMSMLLSTTKHIFIQTFMFQNLQRENGIEKRLDENLY